ncbi:MAG: response regulator transcription factor [Bacteroidetes bacterium]|jgi:two-component system alkaline phosphatase synthesis response regulator PhoP|nr:response regulator transcription factor [Bacteroidota bacterium]MBL0018472.1 response regulator transcription factor [Bacteroidota bacterium]MBP6638680.1 response regulator transcription factor [Bacteroidia bacterium]MBP6721853.1 response regulator transcription factor [Bacteroidia bacterium]
MPKIKILLVDDEEDILELLQYNLEKADFKVLRASNGEEALEIARKEEPDMILLDIMMPRMDGVETCRRLRAMPGGDRPHIIFLTARSEEYSEIAGLEAGADDYVTKPIKPRLLLARLQAIIRRGRQSGPAPVEQSNTLKVGELEINRDEYLVYRKGKPLSLPKKEFELLLFLASQPGKVFTRDILLEQVWGSDVQVVDRTIDVHVRKLREKIGKKWIKTIQGVGYKFTTKA